MLPVALNEIHQQLIHQPSSSFLRFDDVHQLVVNVVAWYVGKHKWTESVIVCGVVAPDSTKSDIFSTRQQSH